MKAMSKEELKELIEYHEGLIDFLGKGNEESTNERATLVILQRLRDFDEEKMFSAKDEFGRYIHTAIGERSGATKAINFILTGKQE